MPTGQEKEAIETRFESNSAKAYSNWDKRQRLDMDLAAFAMAHLNLLLERGKLNFVILGRSSVLLFFRKWEFFLLAV
ncbi:MAG: hypothetical protein M3M88_05240 [Thermoproteota archaeon]|nr:hypothetical protein [Thermoproteota archaeon]